MVRVFFGCCFRLASKLVLRVIHLSSISWCLVDPPKNIHEIGFCGKPPKNQTRTRKHKQKLKFTATIPSRFDTKHL